MAVLMAAMGPEGMAEAARQCLSKAHYLAKALCAIPGVSLRYPGEYFHEFVTELPRVPEVLEALEQLIGAAADHVHPDACALLKFPDNGSVDLLFMGGVDHQPLSLSGGTGKRLRLLCGAACQQGKEQGQNQNLFFHRHISAML